MLTPFERGLLAHLIADWLFQSDWMAQNKTSLAHPASWIHASIHLIALSLALGWPAGVALGIIHLLIDTRMPLSWWRRFFRQTLEGPTASHVAIWSDQVLHLATIGLWVAFMS